MLWQLVQSRIPVDQIERKNSWKALLQEVTHDLESGKLKEWGSFAGEGSGFCIAEGTPAEIARLTLKYVPYVRFETHPLVTASESLENISRLVNP